MESTAAAFPWLKFKELVFGPSNPVTLAQHVMRDAGRQLTGAEQDKVAVHVGLFKASLKYPVEIGHDRT